MQVLNNRCLGFGYLVIILYGSIHTDFVHHINTTLPSEALLLLKKKKIRSDIHAVWQLSVSWDNFQYSVSWNIYLDR